MMKTQAVCFLLIIQLMICSLALAQPSSNPQTFCNPLNLNYRFMVDAVDAREAADAVIVLFQDDYYLFASRSGGYWTSPDLQNWTLIVPTGLDVESYAPAVLAMRDSLFYIPSNNGQIYKTADPMSGVWEMGPRIKTYGDPAFFLDNDERLYMYYGLSNNAPIRGVELDPATFQEIGSPVDIVTAQASIHGWERRGDDNLLDEFPWIEGSWMIKHDNKYYLHYAGPGTEFKTYADGIYVADSPLGSYEYATYSPFSFKPTGFIAGAGHGSTFKDKNGYYWHIGTMTISVQHMFERRLGLNPVAFDADGHIHSNTEFGDYPQYYPGIKANPIAENVTGMMLLSHKKYLIASSSLAEHPIGYAVDEDARTYWCAQTGASDEWLTIDLGKECSIEAIQVNFAEHNTNPDIVRGRDNDDILFERYTVQTSTDGMTWDLLIDKSQNTTDIPHDYIELVQPEIARYVKLSNVFTPGEGNFAIRDLRIFGNSDAAVFTTVDAFTVQRDPADGRDAIIRWSPIENADGYVIRYGIAADKLYNNYMVYGTDSVAIHSLNHGVDYFFEVEAFDSGTDYYSPVGEIRSSQSGNWNDANTWERYDGVEWIQPVPNTPGQSDKAITIQDGHTVTVTATNTDSVDQLFVASGGILKINAGTSLLIKNGFETDLTVEGTIENYGTIDGDPLATISFVGSGIYKHKQNGGVIPKANWKPSSTCVIGNITNTTPDNGNQNFHHLLWNCPNQTANVSMSWDGSTIGGNITIENTGSGSWQLCSPRTGSAATVTINGNIVQSGGHFSANGTSDPHTTVTINHFGNINLTGGTFSVSRGTQGGSGTTIWNAHGNVSLTDATIQNSNIYGAKFVFTRDDSVQILTITGVTYGSGGFPVAVDSGAILNIGTSILQGDGSFELKAGATLMTAHENGIDASIANTAAKIFDQAASYGFNGEVAQVTGDRMPDTVYGLLIFNSMGVTLSSSVVVSGIFELGDALFSTGGNTFSYGSNATLKYSGQSAQTTSDIEFPASAGPKNLIVANRREVNLHASRTVDHIDLLCDLDLGSNTITANSMSGGDITTFVGTSDGGLLKLNSVGSTQTLFPVGTTTFAPVWITNAGDPDAISVGVIKESGQAAYGGRIKARWNIQETNEGGGDYTIQFGWRSALEDSDFRSDRARNAKIFNMTDTTEAGTGDYITQFITQPYTVARGGIENLGPFAVGRFRDVTEIRREPDNIPSTLRLHRNYPNPFNPVTRISYDLPQDSEVNLTIYNLNGRRVAILVKQRQTAGAYQLRWDASNYSSGIYLLRIQVSNEQIGRQVQTRKCLLIK
jgi:xylan 1,4-beta-xylosidase